MKMWRKVPVVMLVLVIGLAACKVGMQREGGASIDESAPLGQDAVAQMEEDVETIARKTDVVVDTAAKGRVPSKSTQACFVKFAIYKFLMGAGYKDFVALTMHGGKDLAWFYESAKGVLEKHGYDSDRGWFPWDKVVGSVGDFDVPVVFVMARKAGIDEPLVFIAASSDLTLDEASDFSNSELLVVAWDREENPKPAGSDYENNYTLYDTGYDVFFMKGLDEDFAAFKQKFEFTDIVSSWKYEPMCTLACSGKDAIAQDVFLSASFGGAFAAANLSSFGRGFDGVDFDKAYGEMCYSKKDDLFRFDNNMFTWSADWELKKSISEVAVFDLDNDFSYDAVKYEAAQLITGAIMRNVIEKELLGGTIQERASDER